MPATTVNRPVSAGEGYRRWAPVYDSDQNPMLSLEERFLDCLLPSANGADVVDLGCGTGRWLVRLAQQSPRSLTGIDASAEMLARAEKKLARRAALLRGDCEAPPIAPDSTDLVLCSFVLSYVANLGRFLEQIHRIVRADARIFITDIHPQTEARLGWRRGFRDNGAHVDIRTHRRSLESIIAHCEMSGFEIAAVIEPCFAEPEFEILRRSGKSAAIESLRAEPAIYILQLRPAAESTDGRRKSDGNTYLERIRGARLALGATEPVSAEIGFSNGQITSLRSQTRMGTVVNGRSSTADLGGFLILPGLVNAHDHLEFALFPRLGKGAYRNFLEWADDIHQSEALAIRKHRSIPKEMRLWWGAIRNLLCGATAVCHHNPYVPEIFEKGFPIRAVRDFGWAHSLQLEPNLVRKHAATPKDQPFVLHLAEGLDRAAASEIFELERIGALTDRTIVVHGLALDEKAFALLKRRRAGLIWCPSSNDFLFGRTHSRETIEKLPAVALGSDSSLTAHGDLLDELRFAQRVGLRDEELYAQVTSRAAGLLRLRLGEGSIRVGAVADVIAIRDVGLTPAETLARSTYRDVELVVVAGCVQLASSMMKSRLPREVTQDLENFEVAGDVRWIRAPVAKLFADAQSTLGHEIRMNGRLLRYGTA